MTLPDDATGGNIARGRARGTPAEPLIQTADTRSPPSKVRPVSGSCERQSVPVSGLRCDNGSRVQFRVGVSQPAKECELVG
jgi:hypothetical protein